MDKGNKVMNDLIRRVAGRPTEPQPEQPADAAQPTPGHAGDGAIAPKQKMTPNEWFRRALAAARLGRR